VNVLLRRNGDGIGDWLLMLQAIKNINRQLPELDVYVDFELKPVGRRPRILSPLVRRAFEISDVRWMPARYESVDLGADAPQIPVVPHVVYERLGYEDYVAGMLRCIGNVIGHELELDPGCLPVYTPAPFRPGFHTHYAAIVAHGKAETAIKNWGVDRFELVAEHLLKRTGCELAQIGDVGDYLLQGAPYKRFLGQPLDTLIAVLNGSSIVICLENAIAVLATQLQRRTVCIYASAEHGERAIGRLNGPFLYPLVAPTIEDVVNYAARCF
jgi:hypothetical protein